MRHELSQIEFHRGPISQTKTGFQLTIFTDIITHRQVAWQREGEGGGGSRQVMLYSLL